MIAEERALARPSVRRLAELQKLKRRPGNLLTAAHLLADVGTNDRRVLAQLSHDLMIELEDHKRGSALWHAIVRRLGFVRLKLHPRGSERELTSLEVERERLIIFHGGVEKHLAMSARQKSKASAARGRNDDGVTIGELIEHLARQYPDSESDPPKVVWGHLRAAIEAAFGECTEELSPKPRYVYPFWSGPRKVKRSLSFRQFRELLSRARGKSRRFR